jgi:hypothetical protein
MTRVVRIYRGVETLSPLRSRWNDQPISWTTFTQVVTQITKPVNGFEGSPVRHDSTRQSCGAARNVTASDWWMVFTADVMRIAMKPQDLYKSNCLA